MDKVNSKNVLFICDSLVKGGKERRMLELIKGLVKNDYSVCLVLISDLIEYDYVYDLPIRLETIRRQFKFELTTLIKLIRIVREFNPSIAHSWGFVSSIYVAPLTVLFNIKFINNSVADSVDNLSFRDKYYLMGHVSFPFSTKVLANSFAGLAAYRVPKRKALCIYNGLDRSRFNGLKDKELVMSELFGFVLPQNCQIVGMVAAFEPRKDFQSLLEAAISLCIRNESLYFLLVGGGRNLPVSILKVPECLSNRIVLTGKMNQIESIINIFDVGVLLTSSDVHREGVSNSILEYMALKKPVIATRGGGTDEVVLDGITGFLIDSYAPKQLEEKLEYLLNNKSLSVEFGKRGFDTFSNKFTLDKMTDAYTKLYEDLIYADGKKN